MYFTFDVLYVYLLDNVRIYFFQVYNYFFCFRAAFGGEERYERGHPAPRQKASPSALLLIYMLVQRLRQRRDTRTPAKGFALWTSTHQSLMEFQAIWPGAVRLAYLVRVHPN
jgi:hypothetical protein